MRIEKCPFFSLLLDVKCGNGGGSFSKRLNAGDRKGAKASSVIIQGEIVVAKLFERKGPSG